MKKTTLCSGLCILLVLALAAVGAAAARNTDKDYVLCVNGSAVQQAEFSLLLNENSALYERQLREELRVPGDKSLLAVLGDDAQEYRRLLAEKNTAHITGLRTEQALAEEYGLIEPFSYPWLVEQMEQENERRAQAVARGEPIYGLRQFSIQQYYSYFMSNLRLEFLHTVPGELLPVSAADVDEYYRNLPYYAHMEGETIYYTWYDLTEARALSPDAQVNLREAVRETLKKREYTEIMVKAMTFCAEKQVFGPRELRNFIRQGEESEFLLSLAEGEVTELFTLGGRDYLAQYNGFDKTAVLSESDRAAMGAYLREKAYVDLVAERAAQAKVRIDKSAMEAYIEEEKR